MSRLLRGVLLLSAALVLLAGSPVAQGQALSPSLQPSARSGLSIAKPTGKLSSRLDALVNMPGLAAVGSALQAPALGLPASGPGSLLEDGQGRMLVDIRVADLSAATLQALAATGVGITHVSEQYHMVTAFAAADSLAALARMPSVENVQEELTPVHGSDRAAPDAVQAQAQAPASPSSACPQGIAVSEGDTQLKAGPARSTYHIDGSGVKVGILSDSYSRDATAVTTAAQDVASGDLPGPANPCGYPTATTVISESLGTGTDEGRAMLQIVHDLAPGSNLAFASAFNGLFQFADNIRALRTWGADIIADDVFYFIEPFYQEGPVNVAISDVVHRGAAYFALAGNNNQIVGGKDVGSYETLAYRPTTIPSFMAGHGYDSCHNFNPAGSDNRDGLTVNAGGVLTIDLQWNQPWFGVTTDLDMYLTDAAGALVAGSNSDNPGPTGSQVPFEFFSYANNTGVAQTFNLYICRSTGTGDTAAPRFKWLMVQGTRGLTAVTYSTSSGGDTIGPTVFGHSSSNDGLSVAAVPYNNSSQPETYTSLGPATHYYGPVIGTAPAGAISPVTLPQPDFAATDGGCNTFFGSLSNGCHRFFGTSAATPHAAAVAALLDQEAAASGGGRLGRAVIKMIMQSTARQVTGGNSASVGAGLIDALAGAGKVAALVANRIFLPLGLR